MSGGVLMRSQEIEEMINYCARVPPAFSAKGGGDALAKVGCKFNVYPALFTRNRNHISVGIHGATIDLFEVVSNALNFYRHGGSLFSTSPFINRNPR
jgi:hypothetical protein